MTEMRQFVPLNAQFIGEPPNYDSDYNSFCPQCGRRLTGNTEGYGFAYGVGVGHYLFCSNGKCNWFYKMLDGDGE